MCIAKVHISLQEVHAIVGRGLTDLAELQGMVAHHLIHISVLPSGGVHLPLGSSQSLEQPQVEPIGVLNDPREQARLEVQGDGFRWDPAGEEEVSHPMILRRSLPHHCLFHVFNKLAEFLLARDTSQSVVGNLPPVPEMARPGPPKGPRQQFS